MRKDAIQLEEQRLLGIESIEDYPDFHERHRVFPEIFEQRNHTRILDIAAGVGCAAIRIHENYPTTIICNDITPSCLMILDALGLPSVSFDIDDIHAPFPFPDEYFDAVISLATIEHVIHLDHHMQELNRVLSEGAYLYLSSPNYAAPWYFPRYILEGTTFHDPLSASSRQRYEFYSHVRYFTYKTLLRFVSSFGFTPDSVYLPIPKESTRFRALYDSSRIKAQSIQVLMYLVYTIFSPRWSSEPIMCFRKEAHPKNGHIKKVVL
jgi:SAM-dependent methyltransferase